MVRKEAANRSRSNRILTALPKLEYDAIAPYLEEVELPNGRILFEPGEPLHTVYYPTTALVSLVGFTQEGATLEVGMVGWEGMIGLPVFLGMVEQPYQVMVQLPGKAQRLSADVFLQASQRPVLRRILLHYAHLRLLKITQHAICNRFHPLKARLCRWLLLAHDRAASNQLQFTQEFVAQMVGARRAAVGLTAGSLQAEGLIHYHRGQITILDRPKLEHNACECYRIVRQAIDQFLDTTAKLDIES